MDKETREDIAQIELELLPMQTSAASSSYAGGQIRRSADSKGQPPHIIENKSDSLSVRAGQLAGDRRRRPSSSTGGDVELSNLKQEMMDRSVDENVPEMQVEEEYARSISMTSGRTFDSVVNSRSSAGALQSNINSRDMLNVMPAFGSASASIRGDAGEPSVPAFQTRPVEIANTLAEVLFVLICSTGQLLFGFLQGGTAGLQLIFIERLGIASSQAPWLQGAFLLANGLSVIVSGPLADMVAPKVLMCGAFAFQTIANLVGVFSLSNKYVFFCVRGAQGLSVGVLVSSSISILGRVYKPGLRKTRVFSIMAAMAPLGFWLGTLQGGALSKDPKWIFAMNSILAGACCAAGLYAIPNVRPAIAELSFKSFDKYGSVFAVVGCALLVAGLTQGPSADWKAYTIVIVMLGLGALIAFFFVEQKVSRPLLPPALWRVPGFTALICSYFLGFGSFMAWQFYAIQFWLKVQKASPLQVAFYLTPNAIFGVLATFIVSRIAHLVHGHWILAASMLAFALGPVFFLPQSPTTAYWALSAPGIALVTFGPDLSFAAASIFVTSSVAKHYQGSAGSLLVTVQNLSAAIMTSLSDTIGERVADHGNTSQASSLKVFHSIWWFDFAASMAAAFIILFAVRIPKTVEKEHEQ